VLKIEVQVENKGERASDEVVQLYGHAHTSRVKRPQRQLIGFRRIHLASGAVENLSFEIPVQKLALWDVTRDRYCLETATWSIMAGRSSADIRQTSEIHIEGETIPARALNLPTFAENYDAYAGVLLDECQEGRSAVRAIASGEPLYREGHSSWLSFHDNAFRQASEFEGRVAAFGEGGELEIRVEGPEGPLLGTCVVPGSAGTVNAKNLQWSTVRCSLKVEREIEQLCIVFKGGAALQQFVLK